MGEALFSSFNNSNRLGHFTAGLGSHLPGEIDQRSLVTPSPPQEQTIHINCLELLAATLAVQTFTQEKLSISILLGIGNMTTVVYINRKERTMSPTLPHMAKTLWLWCMERNISLEAQHLPGVMNSIADRIQSLVRQVRVETLTEHISENQLPPRSPINGPICKSPIQSAPKIFQLETRPSGHGDRYVHFDLVRSLQKVYANSPWNLISIVLSQVYNQSISELILIAPVWKAQAWYTLLLQRLVKVPILFPMSSEMIQKVCQNYLPNILPQLAVRAISGKDANIATFQEQLQTWSSPHGEKSHQSVLIPPPVNGQAGVMNGMEIPFVAI